MSADILSQEEIDALLAGDSSEPPADIPSEESVEAAATPVSEVSSTGSELYSQEHLQDVYDFFNKAFDSAVSVIETILDKEVKIELIKSGAVNADELSAELSGRRSFLKTSFNEGISGEINIFLAESISVIIADLMMGGDGTNPDKEIDDLKQSAINEAFNQMLNSIMTFVSEKIDNKAVSNTLPEISMSDDAFNVVSIDKSDDIYIMVYNIKVADLTEGNIHFVFSTELLNNFMVILGLAQPAETSETPSEPVAEEPQETPKPDLQAKDTSGGALDNLRFLYDVPINYQAVLGKTRLILKDVLELGIGSIIELNKLANEVVEIYVEDKLVARGEVVVIDENFGVRIINLVSQGERVELSKKVGVS